MPTNPESEGSRLITLKQIELEHGVSRSALHTYRRSASFPQPVGVAGSTKIQYRADEVAAWFQANPPQQGKRTDLPAKQQKEPAVAKQETTARPAVKDVPTADLVVWLGQQLDTDERTARAATWCDDAASWHTAPSPYGARSGSERWYVEDAMENGVIAHVDPVASDDEGVARHIAEWDPARVLREIEAKRQLLADLLPAPAEPETDDELHARSAHPAYEYRTTEGPRKQWDDADRPPSGDDGEPEPGWERNTAAGRGGWERFDFTEESHWRRRLPAGEERKPVLPLWLRRLAAVYAARPGFKEEWRP